MLRCNSCGKQVECKRQTLEDGLILGENLNEIDCKVFKCSYCQRMNYLVDKKYKQEAEKCLKK